MLQRKTKMCVDIFQDGCSELELSHKIDNLLVEISTWLLLFFFFLLVAFISFDATCNYIYVKDNKHIYMIVSCNDIND
ncbi:hypothetical protein QQP08_011683, partial [Theobroma cacao]